MNEVFKTIGENFEYEYCNKVNLIPVLHMICIYIYIAVYRGSTLPKKERIR